MNQSFASRLLALAGPLAAILVVLAVLTSPGMPGVPEDPAEVMTYYRDNESGARATAYILAVAMVPMLLFGAFIVGRIRASGARETVLGDLALLAIGTVAMLAISGSAVSAAGTLYNENLGANATYALASACDLLWMIALLPMATFSVCLAIASFKFQVAPRWIGALATLNAVLSFTGSAMFLGEKSEGALDMAAGFGFLTFALLLIATGVTLALRPSEASLAAPLQTRAAASA